MPKSVYSPEQKIKGIQQLVANLGDCERTSKQTGIPERTLAFWKAQAQESTNVSTLIFGIHDPATRQRYERYEKIRDKLVDQVDEYFLKLEKQPADHAENTLALSRLVDRLTKIEAVLQAMGQTSICILFEVPNQQKVFPWERTYSDDEMPSP